MGKARKKTPVKKYAVPYALFALMVCASALLLFNSALTYKGNFIEMEISGIYFENNHAVIIMESPCHAFSFSVPKEEGESISLMMGNSENSPNPQENGVPITIRIIEKDSEYFGEIITNDMLQLKVRTGINDAVILALGSGSPLYINSKLVTKTCE